MTIVTGLGAGGVNHCLVVVACSSIMTGGTSDNRAGGDRTIRRLNRGAKMTGGDIRDAGCMTVGTGTIGRADCRMVCCQW